MTARPLGWAVAAALVLVVVVSGLSVGGTAAGISHAAAPAARPATASPSPTYYEANRSALYATAYDRAIDRGLGPVVAGQVATAFETATPAEIRAANSCLGGVCVPFNLPPWQDGVGAVAGGCVAGLAAGAVVIVAESPTIIGPPIIAGVACAAGAAFGYAGVTAGYNIAKAGLPKNAAQYDLWADTLQTGFWNAANLTGALAATLQSAYNWSAIAFQRMADHAALFQLANVSYDPGLDEAQSGIASMLGTVLTTWDKQSAIEQAADLNAFETQGQPGGLYASDYPGVSLGGGTDAAQSNTLFTVKYYGPTIGGSALSFNAWIPADDNLTFECTGEEVTFQSMTGHDAYFYNFTTGFANVTFGHTDGVWNVTAGGTCQITIPYGLRLVYGSNLNAAGGSVRFSLEGNVGSNAVPVCGSKVNSAEYQYGSGDTTQIFAFSPGGGTCGSSSAVTPAAVLYPYGVGTTQGLEKYYGNTEYQAALNGEAYWSFLKSLGYNSPNQIPADCLVPAPYTALPASYSSQTANMSETQLEAYYLGVLQAEGRFYNSSLSGTQFCGTGATKQFQIGSSNFGNLFVNATGSVYLNNGTGPVNGNGTALPSQKYGNISTWTVHNSQLFLMPELGSIGIPVGKVWNVPVNDPVQVFATTTGQLLTLYGNGTCVDTKSIPCASVQWGTSGPARSPNASYSCSVPGNSCYDTPGASIYLTACSVGGTPSSTCSVQVQTVNETLANYSCGASCTPYVSQPSSGGFSFGNPLSGLTNWLASLFGGGALAQALAGFVTVLLVLAAIGIAVYAVFVFVDNERKTRGAT